MQILNCVVIDNRKTKLYLFDNLNKVISKNEKRKTELKEDDLLKNYQTDKQATQNK